MQLLRNGAKLFLVLALCSCRTDKAPVIEICTHDKVGGGDCVEPDGLKKYRVPSAMENYWCTNQHDMALFTAWAYDVPLDQATAELEKLRASK